MNNAINKLGRSPATSVIYSAWFVAAKFTALAAGTLYSIRSEARWLKRDFCIPHLHSTPPLGGRVPSEYCHTVWYRKTRMAWLPDSEKIEDLKVYVYLF